MGYLISAWVYLLYYMNIDMFWIWLVVIGITLIFQDQFTEKVTMWDVSYTYTTESMDYTAYGQMSLSSPGTSLPWRVAQAYIAKNKSEDDEDIIVTILAVHRDTSSRVFLPFWKHITWYTKV